MRPALIAAYITQQARRALAFIEAHRQGIGLICLTEAGMAAVSASDITVAAGQAVTLGQQRDMFRVGGSICCLIVRPETRPDVDLHGQARGLDATPVPVNARIATLRAPSSKGPP